MSSSLYGATATQAPPVRPTGQQLATMAPPARPAGPDSPQQGMSTPRLLVALRTVSVVLCLLFTGLSLLGTLVPSYQLSYAVGDVSQGQRLREARTQLAQADQIAADAFLAETPPPAELRDFQRVMDSVSTSLILAASYNETDAPRLSQVQERVNTYRRQVDAAVTTSGKDPAAGAKEFAQTSTTLEEPMQILAELASKTDATATSRFSLTFGTMAVVTGWVSVAVLLLASVQTARRTHRVLNPGLAIAMALLLAATLTLTSHQGTTRDTLSSAEQTTIISAHSAGDARTAALRAKAAESRAYLVPDGGYDRLWSQHNQEVTAALARLRPGSLQTTPASQWATYKSAHTGVSSRDARALGRSTGQGGTLGPMKAFVETVSTLERAQTAAATDEINNARRPGTGVMIVCLLCGLGAVGTAAWGLSRRLAEFR